MTDTELIDYLESLKVGYGDGCQHPDNPGNRKEAAASPIQGDSMTREEHIIWAKGRALGYCDSGDIDNALASMFSDLGKHEETQGHPVIELGMMLKMLGHLSTEAKMREFIEGFN